MQLRRAKGIIVVASLVTALLAGYAFLARRGHHRAALYGSAGVLTQLVSDWEREGKPTNAALTNLLASFGSYRPFVFSETVQIDGTNYRCLFGIRSKRFAHDGLLAITPEKVVIWTGTDGNQLVELGHRK